MDLSLSDAASVQTVQVGAEGQTLVVIDNAFTEPEALAESAAARDWREIGPYYPGLRTAFSDGEFQRLREALAAHAAATFGVDTLAVRGECFFSLVTTPPAALMPIQRLPHYDGVEENRLAVVAYLSAADYGGTSFFRHRSSGFESINSARFQAYKQALEAEVHQRGLPQSGYVEEGGALFDRVATVHARFNRLVIFRGYSLHCGALPNDRTLSADPRKGRLTLNAFLY